MITEDAELNVVLLRIQAAIAGTDMQLALNALACQTGVLSVLGAETKGDAYSCARTAHQAARKVVNDLWGRSDINRLRGEMRGVDVQ